MGESKQHHDLVDMISDYIVEYFDISDSIIFRDGVDSGMALPGGSKPDLLCEFDDQIIIGEAKIGTNSNFYYLTINHHSPIIIIHLLH